MTPRRSVLVVIIAVFGGLLVSWLVDFDFNFDSSPPSRDEMHDYLVSKLTDEQIRKLYAEAEAQSKHDSEVDTLARESELKRAGSEYAKCLRDMEDPAYKARHPNGCNMLPITLLTTPKPRNESVDDIFDTLILGPCEFVTTARTARKIGCLP